MTIPRRAGRLPPAEHARIFADEILPRFARGLQPRDTPLAVLLGGQPGVGKSSTKSAVVQALHAHGGAIDFSADLLRPHHPRFVELLTGDERHLAALDADIDLDARAWVDSMIEYATAHRFNAVVDSNLASPDRARGFIDRFDHHGYRVEVLFVAGPSALSRLGVLQRFQDQVDQLGAGAYCATSIQDRNYAGVLDTAAMLDSTVCVDRVAVSRRGAATLHDQVRIDGRWQPAAEARPAIERERTRPWDSSEQDWYLQAATKMLDRLPSDYIADLRDACVLARPLFADPHRRQQLETVIAAAAAQAGSNASGPGGGDAVSAEEIADVAQLTAMNNALPPSAAVERHQRPSSPNRDAAVPGPSPKGDLEL